VNVVVEKWTDEDEDEDDDRSQITETERSVVG
jgi:hypothetical protein